MNKEEIKNLTKVSQNLKILYVEDNESARVSTLDILADFFINIDIAVNGEDGLEKFDQNKYDIIFTDINMPKMNGIDMISNIRKMDDDIPILVLSAYSESGYFMETIRLGVEGYLLKPIELKQFIHMIYKVVEKINLKKENEEYKERLKARNKELKKDVEIKTKELQNIIEKDTLTGLKNRIILDTNISNIKDQIGILFLIDIDNFKNFNKAYGTDKGDEILIQFAKKIEEFGKKIGYEAYRISSDQFVLFSIYDTSKLELNINKLVQEIDGIYLKIDTINEDICINITAGVAIDNENILSRASMALEEAKEKNKKIIIFNNELDSTQNVKNIFYWQNQIAQALNKDRIVPFFQPIFDKDKNILKYESLMRMKLEKEDEIKYISPFFFLDISIKTKQYEELSITMINKVFDYMKLHRDIDFSINLGYKDIQNHLVKDMITNFILETKTLGHDCNIIFEIVESEDIEDYKKVEDFFKDFKCGSIRVAIDDFGSGYSNFNQILNIMPEYVKIDGSLIKDIATDKKSYSLVKAIVSFAKELNIKTIAEYVHNKEVFEILVKEGIDEYQGFYLGEPKAEII